ADGADLHARPAGRAGPHRLRRDRELDQLPRARLPPRERLGDEVELPALVDLQRRRRERLARAVRRADVGAAVALDAGVGVEELREAQVLEPGRAELLGVLVLEVDRLEHA